MIDQESSMSVSQLKWQIGTCMFLCYAMLSITIFDSSYNTSEHGNIQTKYWFNFYRCIYIYV